MKRVLRRNEADIITTDRFMSNPRDSNFTNSFFYQHVEYIKA